MITKCKDCDYWLPDNVQRISAKQGICRRYPPKTISTPTGYDKVRGKITYIDITVKGPTTLDVDGCGEGSSKPSSKPNDAPITTTSHLKPSF